MVVLKIKKVKDNAIMPSYSHDGDAGLDLCSCFNCSLEHGQRMLIPTGISVEIPKGHVGLIWPRSGLSLKKGIDVLAGVIDEGFRGEIGVVLLNTGYDDFVVNVGDRIAQILIQPVTHPEIVLVNDLGESSRGEGRFGSTDV